MALLQVNIDNPDEIASLLDRVPKAVRDAAVERHMPRQTLGPGKVAEELCVKAGIDPLFAMALGGVPGAGIAEIPGKFVPGPFLFATQTDDVTATEVILSGEGGDWFTGNDALTGDVNLSTFMSRDAEFVLIVTGYCWWVNPAIDTDDDGMGRFVGGVAWQHNTTGLQPYTQRGIGHTARLSSILDYNRAVAADDVSSSPTQFGRGKPYIPRPIDMQNDEWTVTYPASTGIDPAVIFQVDGIAIDRTIYNKLDTAEWMFLAYLNKAALSYGAANIDRTLAAFKRMASNAKSRPRGE